MNRGTALTLVFVFCVLACPARGDWVNLSGAENAPNIAEIYVEDDHVKVVLEVYIHDALTFETLIPEDMLPGPVPGRPGPEERMRRFSEDVLRFITDDGTKLPARLDLVEPRFRKHRPSPFAGTINPYTRQLIPGPPEDKRVLYAEIVYPFETKPASLTIVPPLTERGGPAVSVGFFLYHKGVPATDFRYLPASAVIDLDWDDPWYSAFRNRSLKRWQRGGVMSFVYVEPFEVRHEILARVRDLEQWMDLGLRGEEYIEIDEFDAFRKRVGEFLIGLNKVTIDGASPEPILDRTAFVKYSRTGSVFLETPERLPITTAMIGVIFTYNVESIPREITVDWELFSDRIQKIPTNVQDPAGPFPSYVDPEDNVIRWTNFLKTYRPPTVEGISIADTVDPLRLPVVTILCALFLLPVAYRIARPGANGRGRVRIYIAAAVLIAAGAGAYPFVSVTVDRPLALAGRFEDARATEVLDSLLRNVYRSFDFREEADVYDRLALVVSGGLLEDIYLQNRKSFEIKRAGGAVARVKEVEVQGVEVDLSSTSREVALHAKWTATGTVGHWGHVHTRKNLYSARVTLSPIEGLWKMSGMELLSEERVDFSGGVPVSQTPSGGSAS
ncbi:MAG: hypothetical protein ACYTAN_07185 [Planctomycetota bacterium]|jgi:hypothetical protein